MKKGLKNFLNKQKKKANQADAADPTANASAEEKKQVSDEPKEVAVESVQEKAPEKKTAAKPESSDEEDDDLELKTGAYGNIAEEEEKAMTQADDESKNTPAFTMEEEKKPDPPKKEKKTASNITFGGGKPRFGRGRGAVINDKNDGKLEDLLDEEPQSKKKAKKETEMLTRQAMAQKQEAPQVEEKKGPVKPTFRGKLNLRGAGADTNDSGVKTNYGFEVKYRTEHGEGPKKDGDEKPSEVREGVKKVKKHGQQITVEEAEKQEENPRTVDEDGFELVGAGNDRKARRQLGRPKDEEEEDDGFKIVRNEKRGGAFAAMNG